jgi:hypothetical protein
MHLREEYDVGYGVDDLNEWRRVSATAGAMASVPNPARVVFCGRVTDQAMFEERNPLIK